MKLTGEFHLLPSIWQGRETSTLRSVYQHAFKKAEELFIVSAFLTEWDRDLSLNPGCSAFRLIVGADFGTTRKAAVREALDWLPMRFAGNVLAYNLNGVSFHPKAMLWREKADARYMLVGSSNLTTLRLKATLRRTS